MLRLVEVDKIDSDKNFELKNQPPVLIFLLLLQINSSQAARLSTI